MLTMTSRASLLYSFILACNNKRVEPNQQVDTWLFVRSSSIDARSMSKLKKELLN